MRQHRAAAVMAPVAALVPSAGMAVPQQSQASQHAWGRCPLLLAQRVPHPAHSAHATVGAWRLKAGRTCSANHQKGVRRQRQWVCCKAQDAEGQRLSSSDEAEDYASIFPSQSAGADHSGNGASNPAIGQDVATKAEEAKEAVGQVVTSVSRWKRRWTIVALCFVAFMLCNMDRVNMSIAVMPMAAEFGWDTATTGIVQSSFFWGYLLTQVAGGVWADRFGGKRVLGFGVIWWSIATAMTPIAAKMGLPVLLAARACMGVGEGVAMPAMNNLLSRWIPVGERSRSLSLVYSGMYTGSILGLALSPHMIQVLHWPSVFYIFGFMGIFWFIAWQKFAGSSPEEDTRISTEERIYIVDQTVTRSAADKIPWKLILSKRAVWALILSHFCHNWGTFILLTWMPTYYNQVLGMDLLKSGFFSVLPWITMAISANVGGWIADTLVGRGVSVTRVRKIMQTIGFMGPAFFLTQLSKVTTAGQAVGCMMACQGLDAFSQSGLYSNHQDIAPRYSGVLLGMSNTAGVLAGVLGTAATGMILKTGSWDDVWHVSIILYCIGTLIWNTMSTGERVID